MNYYALTDIGKIREKNQDEVAVATNKEDQILGLVCDGMGGHKAGEIASHVVKDHVLRCFHVNPAFEDGQEVKNWMMDTVLEAHQIVKRMAKMDDDTLGMGTTVAMTVIIKDDLYVCHVGDSRVYLYDDNHLLQVTKDHTLVNELIDRGAITEEEAQNHRQKNVLMQAIGVDMDIIPDIACVEREHKNVMICSDGLYNALSIDEIMAVLSKDCHVEEKTYELIQLANQNGGYDNISAVLIEEER